MCADLHGGCESWREAVISKLRFFIFQKVTQVPQIVTVFDNQWIPDPWFVAVLAVTGALLLLALALLIWKLLSMYVSQVISFMLTFFSQ